MSDKKSFPNPIMILGLGVAVAWVAKKLFESPAMKKQHDEIVASAEDLSARLFDSDEGQRLQEIFGEVSDEAKSAYESAQKQLVKELAALKMTLPEIDRDKYLGTVSTIISEFKDNQTLPEKQLKKLQTALEEDFQKLQKNRAVSRRAKKS